MILCIPVTSSILCQTGTCMKSPLLLAGNTDARGNRPWAFWLGRLGLGHSDWVDLALGPHMYLQPAGARDSDRGDFSASKSWRGMWLVHTRPNKTVSLISISPVRHLCAKSYTPPLVLLLCSQEYKFFSMVRAWVSENTFYLCFSPVAPLTLGAG